VRDPNIFLSAVQVGVTVAGFFSSAFGAATIAPYLSRWLVRNGVVDDVADPLSLVVLTLLIAYCSLVLGELVPKRLAMQRASGFTTVLAPPLGLFARALRPVIRLLSVSTNLVVRLVGADPEARGEEVSLEELRRIVEDNRDLRPYSRQILTDVFRASERSLGDVLRPRPDVDFLRADATLAEVDVFVRRTGRNRYPVLGENLDDVLGYAHIRDLLGVAAGRRTETHVRALVRDIVALPVTQGVLPALSVLREHQQHIALVVDEHGGTEGIVTIEDLVEELVGEIYDEFDTELDPEDFDVAEDGTAQVSGSLIVEELEDALQVMLPRGPYETVAGLILDQLGRVARTGDEVEVPGARLRVLQMKGLRITQVAVNRTPPPTG
jgi:putative hemolysin